LPLHTVHLVGWLSFLMLRGDRGRNQATAGKEGKDVKKQRG
jgi:hypothetical protein